MKRSLGRGLGCAGLLLVASAATGIAGAHSFHLLEDPGAATGDSSAFPLDPHLANPAAIDPTPPAGHSQAKRLDLAWQAVGAGRRLANPGYFDQARALLSDWWDDPDAPADVLLLRAIILQFGHEFGAALRDLDRALAQDSSLVQAWLTRAAILQVQGRPAAALESCARVLTRVPRIVSSACAAVPAYQLGRGKQALDLLTSAIADRNRTSPPPDPAVLGWAYRAQSAIAEPLGRLSVARRALLAALALEEVEAASLTAYLDLLLRHGEAHAVIARLAEEPLTPMLELRLAEAEHALGSVSPNKRIARLRTYFGMQPGHHQEHHLREAARAHLTLFGDPEKALALARSNWAVQREDEDARLLIEAALASGEADAAAPVLDWIRAEGIVSPRLDELLDRIPGKKGAGSLIRHQPHPMDPPSGSAKGPSSRPAGQSLSANGRS